MFPVACTYLSSSFYPSSDCLSGCPKNVGETGGCLPSWSDPAKLLFEAASLRKVLWDCPIIRNCLRWHLNLYKRRLIGELLVTFSWSTLCDYYSGKSVFCQLIKGNICLLSDYSVYYIQFDCFVSFSAASLYCKRHGTALLAVPCLIIHY